MKISFIVCGNGFGHIKRVLSVSDWISKLDKDAIVTVIGATSHQDYFDTWSEGVDCNNIRFINGQTESNLMWKSGANYKFSDYRKSWDHIQDKLEHCNPEIVVSDNLVGVLDHYSNAALMGSFLWSEVYNRQGSTTSGLAEIASYEEALLAKHSPRMIGVHDMASIYVRENTDFVGLPWFCEPNNVGRSTRQVPNVLITGGGTGSNADEVISVAKFLTESRKATVFVDSRLKALFDESADLREFQFKQEDFQSLDWIVCRPGVGILTDAVKYHIPVCAIREQNNNEIIHNAETVVSLGIGFIYESLESTLQTIIGDATHYREAFKKLEYGGAKAAAEIILAS